MGQLGIDQTHHMAPRLKGARPILRSGSPCDFGHLVGGNKIANLAQDVQLIPCWVDRFIFHPCLVAGPKRQPNTFFPKSGGWLWFRLMASRSDSTRSLRDSFWRSG